MMKILCFVLYTLFVFTIWAMLKVGSDADDRMEELMNKEKGDN